MSYADQVFVSMCQDILENGTDTKGEAVRPHWPDGEKAYTIKKFGVVNRYDLSKEFPALTLRKTPIKSCTEEMLWIWQKKSNNIHDLGSHVWDEWADEQGSIGKAYGYQLGKEHPYKDITYEKLCKAFGDVELVYPEGISEAFTRWDYAYINGGKVAHHYPDDGGYWTMDQVNRVIYDLKLTPYNRRVLTNMYVHADLSEMALSPCAYSMIFNATGPSDNLKLNGILIQRSQDTLAANSWNVCQYAVLLHMMARECDMQVGELVHMIADCHIYDRHVDIIKELISREQYPAPTFWLNPEKHDFYSFTKDDVRLDNYQAGEQVKDIPIAI